VRHHHPNVEEEVRRMDALPLRTLCALCGWVYEGSALDGREKAIQHRLKKHPDLKVTRRRPPSHLKSFRQSKLKPEDVQEIFTERDRRAKLLGIDVI